MRNALRASLLAIVLGGPSTGAMAADWSPSLSVTAASDERRRGLSWSDGRPALSGRFDVMPVDDLTLSATATSLRRSVRHDGATLGIDTALAWRRSFGAIDIDAQATHHAFPGREGLNYIEIGGGAATLIGPVQLEGFALYAPSQNAIGGDNLYLGAAASLAIVGTPWSIRTHIGRSSGDSDDPLRAARLRPRGRYADAGLTVEHVQGPIRASLSYTDSFAFSRAATGAVLERDMGSRLLARISFDLIR